MNQFKQQILPLFEANREEFICQARQIAELLGEKGLVTINDVRKYIEPPEGVDPRVMGAVFATKQWERVGYTASERAHGRPIAIFRRRAA
tara:strand:- start:644 stop:913 length:270 start_codon:yes stop_codon:yes gene_type:complete